VKLVWLKGNENLSWHKVEGEDILKAVKLKVQFEEKPVEGLFRGTYKTISDKEHVEIIRLYCEKN